MTKNYKFDILAIIIASLTLVTTTAWNNFIQTSIKYYFPEENNSLSAQLLYNTILTISVAVIIYYIANYSQPIQDTIKQWIEKIKDINVWTMPHLAM